MASLNTDWVWEIAHQLIDECRERVNATTGEKGFLPDICDSLRHYVRYFKRRTIELNEKMAESRNKIDSEITVISNDIERRLEALENARLHK